MRTPGIRYFQSRNAYYCQHKGQQYRLATGPRDEPDGPTYRAAAKRFAEIVGSTTETVAIADSCQVFTVIGKYYESLERAGRAETFRVARSLLDPAMKAFGAVRVDELRPIMVSDWLAKMAEKPKKVGKGVGRWRAWNSTTQASALNTLLSAFNWAAEQGVISKNPIAGMPRLERRSRGAEVVPPDEIHALLIASANRELAKLLRVLRGTGARPGEIIHAECRHYRPAIGAIIHPWNAQPGEYQWKCAKKTRRDRVIYLDDELKGLVESEISRRGGKGRIFRTVRHDAWTGNNLRNRLAFLANLPEVVKCCKRHSFDPSKLIIYGFRHAFITRMMTVGAPIKFVADLCGTSVKQIERTYSHAHDDHEAMRRLFLQFRTAACCSPAPKPSDSTP